MKMTAGMCLSSRVDGFRSAPGGDDVISLECEVLLVDIECVFEVINDQDDGRRRRVVGHRNEGGQVETIAMLLAVPETFRCVREQVVEPLAGRPRTIVGRGAHLTRVAHPLRPSFCDEHLRRRPFEIDDVPDTERTQVHLIERVAEFSSEFDPHKLPG